MALEREELTEFDAQTQRSQFGAIGSDGSFVVNKCRRMGYRGYISHLKILGQEVIPKVRSRQTAEFTFWRYHFLQVRNTFLFLFQ